MDTTTTFAPPSGDVARANLSALFAAYQAATGYSTSFIWRSITRVTAADGHGLAVQGEHHFHGRMEQGFSFATYDRIVSRLSALGPAGLAWPPGVPRPAPATIDDKTLAEINDRALLKSGEKRPKLAWPADIPKPGERAAAAKKALREGGAKAKTRTQQPKRRRLKNGEENLEV